MYSRLWLGANASNVVLALRFFASAASRSGGVSAGGFGAAVMEAFATAGVVKRVTNIGVPDRFLPFGSAGDVMESVGMDPDSVVERVLLAVGTAR